MNLRFGVLCLCLLVGCTVKYRYVQAGYKNEGKGVVKRIALLVEPSAVQVRGLAGAVAAMEREFLSVESTYILPPDLAPDANVAGRVRICERAKNLEGVLVTEIRKLERKGSKVALGVRTALWSCAGNRLWDSYAESSYSSEDSDRAALVQAYTAKFGPDVQPYLVPVYEILRKLLDSIPRPKLSPGEERERIQNFRAPISEQKKS